jgi:hypothetical protein
MLLCGILATQRWQETAEDTFDQRPWMLSYSHKYVVNKYFTTYPAKETNSQFSVGGSSVRLAEKS